MKKKITFILLAFTLSASAQQYTPMTAAGYQFKRILCDSTLHIPSFCGTPTIRNSTAKNGALAIDTCGNKLYKWTRANGWSEIGNSLDTTDKWVNAVTKINDTAIRVWKGDTSTVISFAKDIVYTESPIMSKISGDSNIIYFNADTAAAWRGGGSVTIPTLQEVTNAGAISNNEIALTDNSFGIFYTDLNKLTFINGAQYYAINSNNNGSYNKSAYIKVYDDAPGSYSPELKLSDYGGTYNEAKLNLNELSWGYSNTIKLIPYAPYGFPSYNQTFHLPIYIDHEVDTLATLNDIRNAGGGSGTVTSIATGYGLSGGTITTSGSILVDTATLSNKYLPYIGATADVDLGTHILNAHSLGITGTSGNGHLNLRHQSSDATATGQSTALFADANGDLKWKNDGNYYTTLKTSTNTANRIYTYPNSNTTLIGASDTASMLTNYAKTNLVNTKLNISDTTVFQRKSLSSYTLMANNTASTANATAQTYIDAPEQNMTNTITWSGGTAPTSLTSANYSWSQIGKTVTFVFNVLYANAATSITGMFFNIPSDLPTPAIPTGWTGASGYLYTGTTTTHLTATAITNTTYPAYLRRNAANTAYEVGFTGTSSARGYKIIIIYRAQ